MPYSQDFYSAIEARYPLLFSISVPDQLQAVDGSFYFDYDRAIKIVELLIFFFAHTAQKALRPQ